MKKAKKGLQKFTPTKASERLLLVLSKPENYLLPVADICKQAKISRTWYYKLYKDEKFRQKVIVLAGQIFASATPVVAHKIAKEAIKGSLAHQEIILEATGVIRSKGTPGQQASVNIFQRLAKEDKEFIINSWDEEN